MVLICVEMDKNKSRTDLLAAGRKKVLVHLLCLFILCSLGFFVFETVVISCLVA